MKKAKKNLIKLEIFLKKIEDGNKKDKCFNEQRGELRSDRLTRSK
jgi:hypothetical protein